MLVLIHKDSSTSVPREVADMAEARALASNGMAVSIQNDDGSRTPVEPEDAPAEDAAEEVEETAKPAAKKTATRKR